jgi:predicted enzyme related to lactoylglutathione lyase
MPSVGAVLFAKDLQRVASFYVGALGMTASVSDAEHWRLHSHGFELIVHQIPKPIAEGVVIEQPPKRRVWGTIRLDYPVANLAESRKKARSLGGSIDDAPPWRDAAPTFFLGYDPEGNVFGVSEQA